MIQGTLDIGTGITQNSDPSTHSDMGQEGTLTPHEETLTPEKVTQGLKRPPRVDENQGGLKMIMWGLSHMHPFWTNFLEKKRITEASGVKFKNMARVRVDEPRLSSKLRKRKYCC